MSEWDSSVTIGEIHEFLVGRMVAAKIELGDLALKDADLLTQKGIVVGTVNDLHALLKLEKCYRDDKDAPHPLD